MCEPFFCRFVRVKMDDRDATDLRDVVALVTGVQVLESVRPIKAGTVQKTVRLAYHNGSLFYMIGWKLKSDSFESCLGNKLVVVSKVPRSEPILSF